MKDYDAIEETVFHSFEGYQDKGRVRWEGAFVVEIANMMGYRKNDKGEMELFTVPYRGLIERCVDPEFSPREFGDGNILSVDIFSDVAAHETD